MYVNFYTRSLIADLQHKSKRVFEHDRTTCPQRPIRRAPMQDRRPDRFALQRGRSQQTRSLVDLTADKKVMTRVGFSAAFKGFRQDIAFIPVYTAFFA